MAKDSRTLLEKTILKEEDGESLPERIRYSVIANRSVGMGGSCTNDIYAERFNRRDYLIINSRNIDDDKQPLAIVNERYTDVVVLSILYEKALEVANERAKLDGNSVLDLTGNVPIPDEAKYYRDRYR
jgi:hypothetical protein